MKIIDMIHRYPTHSAIGLDGICRVRIFINSNGEIHSLLTDLASKNPSSSVTNSVENIYHSLIQRGIIPAESKIIEHYEDIKLSNHTFDLVSFNKVTEWTKIKLETVLALLDCEETELSQLTATNSRLVNEIDRIRYEINPHVDFPYREDPDVIRRRMDIESNSIDKASILKLIQDGSKEQDIARHLKKDLSVFGEVYANPDEEYICFSEFPIFDGFVDYVVFTSRSRMDIYLIEAKGANFNLVNQGGYESFSSKVEEAAGQLRKRIGLIYKNYETFRKEVHQIRVMVESGEKIYNSLIGPKGYLEVDPNKEINIFPVLIAGRTVDDFKESLKRHEYENSTKPTIKVESWDSWLRKLRRQ